MVQNGRDVRAGHGVAKEEERPWVRFAGGDHTLEVDAHEVGFREEGTKGAKVRYAVALLDHEVAQAEDAHHVAGRSGPLPGQRGLDEVGVAVGAGPRGVERPEGGVPPRIGRMNRHVVTLTIDARSVFGAVHLGWPAGCSDDGHAEPPGNSPTACRRRQSHQRVGWGPRAWRHRRLRRWRPCDFAQELVGGDPCVVRPGVCRDAGSRRPSRVERGSGRGDDHPPRRSCPDRAGLVAVGSGGLDSGRHPGWMAPSPQPHRGADAYRGRSALASTRAGCARGATGARIPPHLRACPHAQLRQRGQAGGLAFGRGGLLDAARGGQAAAAGPAPPVLALPREHAMGPAHQPSAGDRQDGNPPMMLSLLIVSCALNPDGDDQFWFRNAGADMPVWVRGDPDADVMLVHLHGGPGGPGLLQDWLYPEAAARLEERYLAVWWDQRSSGIAVGHAKPESLTLDQFVEDTDVLVDLLAETYRPRHLVLWGHSWGGALGTAYLADPGRQAKISAWIEVDGAHDSVTGFALSRQWVMAHAEQELAAGRDPEVWTEALAFYDANPRITMDNLDEHGVYLEAAHAYTFDPDPPHVDMVGSALFGPMSSVFFSNLNHIREHLDYTNLDLNGDLSKISLPTLVLWGRHDGVLPVALAEPTMERLGTPNEDAVLHVLERSGHSPQAEEPEAFVNHIEDFLEDAL